LAPVVGCGPVGGTGRRGVAFPHGSPVIPSESNEGVLMLYWAVVFLIIAIIAGVLGFGGIASTASGIAEVLFFIFLVIFVIALIMGLMRRRPPPI
jgi:uncharacterized membrane protein YtjA (UPF0391 family)